jgi:hypothetical protein
MKSDIEIWAVEDGEWIEVFGEVLTDKDAILLGGWTCRYVGECVALSCGECIKKYGEDDVKWR